jgi:adenosylhomocysteine nucleosidase
MTSNEEEKMTEANRTRKWLLVLFLTFVCAGSVIPRSDEKPEGLTAILGAFPEETKFLLERVYNKETHTLLGIPFITGELEGRKVVVVLTGVGKVNAAMTTTLLLDHFRPTEVIFTGIAGGIRPGLAPGDIVIAETLAQYDFGLMTSEGFMKTGTKNPVNGERNPVFLPSDTALVKLALREASDMEFDPLSIDGELRKPKVLKGVIVTGDLFVASEEKKAFFLEEFGADAVEMEGAAVAQVCFQQGVSFIVVRSMSDKANKSAQSDLLKFYKKAARNSAMLTINLIKALQQ